MKQPDFSQRRVLILDDDPAVLQLLTSYLRSPGVALVACKEIEAAECLLASYPFHIFVCDLKLSALGGLEGMRIVRHVATNFPEIRTVIFSGMVDEQVRELANALGVDDVMEKPRDLPQLRKIILPNPETVPASESAEGEVVIVESLDDVLRSDQLSAQYQPIMALQQGSEPFQAYGVESLTRGPEGSMLRNPEILFGYAARKEKFFEADMLALTEAFRGAKDLPKEGVLFVNVQPRSMSHREFSANLLELAREGGYSPNRVVLEITEQRTIVNPKAFATAIEELRSQGFRIALDDYGEGFANLHLVHDLQPDFLKISGYFCNDIHVEPRKQAVVGASVNLAERLNVITIMEHVETAEELAAVRRLGVQYGQGYFFSRPVSAKEAARSIRFRGSSEE